jgi:hypothetical protein
MAQEPRTLQQAIKYFADPDNCLNYLVARRWPNGVLCPICGSDNVSFLKSRRLWQCKTRHPKAQFSIKVGTIFEDSAIGLDKWLTAMWMVANCKNGVSSWEIHRAIGVTQKSAWFMLHRIRLALQDSTGGKLSGEVEVDETYIGGLARNMHTKKRLRVMKQSPNFGKTIVMGLLERHGKDTPARIRLNIIPDTSKLTMQTTVKETVEPGTALYTDEHAGYKGLDQFYAHQFINHAETYAAGSVHTQGLENFWSLLKRGIKGTYVSIEPFHMFRYLDEQAFRFNYRKDIDGEPLNDGDRMAIAVSQILGKRLTYAGLTGKTGEKPF